MRIFLTELGLGWDRNNKQSCGSTPLSRHLSLSLSLSPLSEIEIITPLGSTELSCLHNWPELIRKSWVIVWIIIPTLVRCEREANFAKCGLVVTIKLGKALRYVFCSIYLVLGMANPDPTAITTLKSSFLSGKKRGKFMGHVRTITTWISSHCLTFPPQVRCWIFYCKRRAPPDWLIILCPF